MYGFIINNTTNYFDYLGLSDHKVNPPWRDFHLLKQHGAGYTWFYGPWKCRQVWVNECKAKCEAKGQTYLGCVWIADLRFRLKGVPYDTIGRVAFTHCCCDCPDQTPEETDADRREYNAKRDKIRETINDTGVPQPPKEEPNPRPGDRNPPVQHPPLHHIDPISKGGDPTDPNNTIPLPSDTHSNVHTAYNECYKKPSNGYTEAGPDWPEGSR
jgi:hypothetical protein